MSTEAQRAALRLGMKIRTLAMIDTHARIHFQPEDHAEIRAILDREMTKLGYETLTRHHERTMNAFIDGETSSKRIKEIFKYQRVRND
jgi:hypothetical protein